VYYGATVRTLLAVTRLQDTVDVDLVGPDLAAILSSVSTTVLNDTTGPVRRLHLDESVEL